MHQEIWNIFESHATYKGVNLKRHWCTYQKFVIDISLSLSVKRLWEKCTNVARLNYKNFWNIMGSWKLQNVVLNFWHSENWFWNFENFSFVHSRIVEGSVSWYLISLKGIVNWKLLTDILKIFELPATHERKNLNSYKGIYYNFVMHFNFSA